MRYTWGSLPTDYAYTGQRKPGETGLYYYQARWYDPALGRFVQADPLIPLPEHPTGWDRYSYVLNNPLRYIDPTGYYSETPDRCGPDGVNCDHPTPDSSIDWDPETDPGLPLEEMAKAEDAYLHALEDPGYFVDLYFNSDPKVWESNEVKYLEIYLQYSSLHMTAEEFLLAGYDLRAAALARMFFNAGDNFNGNIQLITAIAGVLVVPNSASTGRTEPLSIREKLAMEEVLSNPLYEANKLQLPS